MYIVIVHVVDVRVVIVHVVILFMLTVDMYIQVVVVYIHYDDHFIYGFLFSCSVVIDQNYATKES